MEEKTVSTPRPAVCDKSCKYWLQDECPAYGSTAEGLTVGLPCSKFTPSPRRAPVDLDQFEGIELPSLWQSSLVSGCETRLINVSATILDLRETRRERDEALDLLEEMASKRTLYLSDDYGLRTCVLCNADYHDGMTDYLRKTMRDNNSREYEKRYPKIPADHKCTNPDCPAVKARALLWRMGRMA